MSNVNMQLPPPTVTGVAIPANLDIKSELANYREIQAMRNQARNAVIERNKKYQGKDSYSTPTSIKVLGGIIAAAGAFLGIKALIKK